MDHIQSQPCRKSFNNNENQNIARNEKCENVSSSSEQNEFEEFALSLDGGAHNPLDTRDAVRDGRPKVEKSSKDRCLLSSVASLSKGNSAIFGFTDGENSEECDNKNNVVAENCESSVPVNYVYHAAGPSGMSGNVQTNRHAGHFVCPFCGKKFKRKDNFIIHYRQSIDDKPYLCEKCGLRFVTQSHLNKHLIIHSSNKPYECDSCEKKFHSKSNLSRHQLTHTGEKKKKCFLCAKAYSRQDILKRHLREIHGLKFVVKRCQGKSKP